MENYQVYGDILKNGELSAEKIHNTLQSYSENVKETSERITKESGLTGDELADEIFNDLDEELLVSFDTEKGRIEVSLSRYRDDEEPPVFGAGYLIENRNEQTGIIDVDEFDLGEENKLIQKIEELKQIK